MSKRENFVCFSSKLDLPEQLTGWEGNKGKTSLVILISFVPVLKKFEKVAPLDNFRHDPHCFLLTATSDVKVEPDYQQTLSDKIFILHFALGKCG